MAALTATTLLSIACGGESSSSDPVTWQEYRALAAREFEGRTLFVLDGDLPVDEAEVAQSYERYIESLSRESNAHVGTTTQNLLVNRVNGADDKWSDSDAGNLTYCVSDDFEKLESRMIKEMKQAADDWEARANVSFKYVKTKAGECKVTDKKIVFAVKPWKNPGARAFFPSTAAANRTIVINVKEIDDDYAPITTLGVLRHELGHVLGLRHEHLRGSSERPFCKEDKQWRSLTEYDSASVMHYPWCEGTRKGDLVLTDKDKSGIAALYPKGK